MSQQEITFYNNNGNIVTNRRVVLNGTTIAANQIVTINRTKTDKAIYPPMSEEEKGAAGGGCFGLIFLVAGIIGLLNRTNNLMLAGSVLALFLGLLFLFLLAKTKIKNPPIPKNVTTYYVSIATSNTALPLQSYQTTDQADADAIESALNNAIASQ